jgi:LPXTG-site transpeptidase (sortase) family protein
MKRVVGRNAVRGIGLLLVIAGLGFGSTQFSSNTEYLAEPIVSIPTAEAQTLVLPKGMRPNKLIIPDLKINASVRAMGLDEGRMAVPNNYTEVGWYKLGSKPGEQGSAVMGAHVDNGGKINGVFKNLKKLAVGDDIYVTDANNNALHFKVTARKIFPYQTKITDEVFMRNDKPRLNLITCYGTWLPKQNTYNQRLVVFAELVTPQN